MKIPRSIPRFKFLMMAAVGLLAVVWPALEGNPALELLLAAVLMSVGIFYIITILLGGRTMTAGQGIALTTVAGLSFGAGLVLLTIFLMALKTGLHAHGPEYTPQEITWVWRQLPLWAGVGGLAGLGVGLLAAGRRMATDRDG